MENWEEIVKSHANIQEIIQIPKCIIVKDLEELKC